MRNTVILTGTDGGENGVEGSQNATRTGYYLKKLLREDVNANPSSPSAQQNFITHIRYTELFINYAEAANEANTMSRSFSFQVDPSLCNNVLFGAEGDTIRALPQNYYTLSSTNTIEIPKDAFNGGIEVQLTDAFFNDPMAIKNSYVVPLKITGSNDVDTILVGSSPNPNADPRDASQWVVAPKNFTMFAVKYINEYHGTYFHYGQNTVRDGANAVVETQTYSAQYVENNTIARLHTSQRNQVSFSTFLKSQTMENPNVELLLTFSGNNCTVTADPGSGFTVTGTGEFKPKAYSWGNKDRDGIVINFTVSDGTYTYEASDVLVIRDRAVAMETYTPVIY